MIIAFVSEIPARYRSPLFELLRSQVDLRVLYCAENDPWRGPNLQHFGPGEEVLPGIAFGGRRGFVHWKVNPTVWSRLTSLGPDIVIISGYAHPTMQIAMLWARFKRVPYVLHSESNDLTPRAAWRRALKAPVVRWAVRGASAFLPVSKNAARYLARRGADATQMHVLPNSPDVHAIAANAIPLPVNNDRPPTFLFVGRLVRAKDPLTLLEAFRLLRQEVPEARLRIVGEGPLMTEAQIFCHAHRVEGVSFAGFVAADGIMHEYAKSDCFVLPSRDEPYGVVVLEAMAAGRPVILSDRVGCADDLVDEGRNGFIFPAGDVEALALRMRQVTRSASGQMGRSAQEVALRFDYDMGVSAVIAAAASALRGRSRFARG